jgi:N-methylhydantoinase A
VARYVRNLHRELKKKMKNVQLHVLRSDGGLASAKAAESYPVNMLMSGPAGGVTGAIWVGNQAGFKDILTFDMGGTSTDVALIQDGKAQLRRETSVHDVTVRASSVDVRTVGAGGGSIAYVPEITGALRVGPQSAGAAPGPAAYNKGGVEPTVTDANVVLGYLPGGEVRLGGDMVIRRDLAEAAVAKVAKALKLPVKQAAAGIIDIVNENMYGALRLVSVEKGYDPRDFALMGFGGAGPLHANALGKLSSAWPVIIPQGPGVLCALGDATTSVRDEASRTFMSRLQPDQWQGDQQDLPATGCQCRQGTGPGRHPARGTDADLPGRHPLPRPGPAADGGLRHHRTRAARAGRGGRALRRDAPASVHLRAAEEKEIVNLRAVAQGRTTAVRRCASSRAAAMPRLPCSVTIRCSWRAGTRRGKLYDRSRLKAGNVVRGPAVILQMDTTTLILPGHIGRVDEFSNILITPE